MIRRKRAGGIAAQERLEQLEHSLEKSDVQRDMLQRALYEVQHGIVVITPTEEIAFMNPQSARLIRPSATLSQVTPHALQRLVRTARETGTRVEQELEIGRPARLVAAAASPLEEAGVVLVLNDVTESRRIEALRRDFVAAASHELKTPVASALASAEALQLALTRDPSSARQFSDQVEASARQLANLVGDLLDLSRLESKPEYDEELDLDQVVEAEVGAFAERAERAGVTLRIETVLVKVLGSPSDLGLALRNLLDNALRHTPAGGQVTVSLTSGDAGIDLEVTDTGEGIASRELPRIFERFYRADPARSRATGGTGLGLAIVRHVVEAHGGTITASSVLGEGATFTIRLRALAASEP